MRRELISEEMRVDLGIPLRSVITGRHPYYFDYCWVDGRCLKRYRRRWVARL